MTREEIENMPAGDKIDGLIASHIFPYTTHWEGSPKYSTDIAAAWEVVEKVAGVDSELEVHMAGDFAGWGWTCVIGNAFVDYFAKAETAPLAICRAALIATL